MNAPFLAPSALLSAARLRLATDVVLAIGFLYVVLRLGGNYLSGGHEWKQGDWLINNESGYTRRGFFGSAFLSISDVLGSNPLLLVVVVQFILLVVLLLSYRLLVTRTSSTPMMTLLLVSPAIFTIFWVADPQAALRKEILAFAGLSLSALAVTSADNRVLFWPGTLLLCLSFVSHEAMILFLPVFLAILYISNWHKAAPIQSIAASAVVLATALLVGVYSFNHAQPHDAAAVCAPLLERGLSASVCDGAIKWLQFDGDEIAERIARERTTASVTAFLIAYAISLAPFAYIAVHLTKRPTIFAALILSALPFFPLYFVAADWGRWISFHVFSVAVLLVCALSSGRISLAVTPKLSQVWLLAAMSLLVSPHHVIGVIWGGAVGESVDVVGRNLD